MECLCLPQSGIQQICFFTFQNKSTNTFSLSTFQQVASAIRSGVNPAGTLANHSSLWDLSSAFFFAGTVITTIGGTHTRTVARAHTYREVRLVLSFRLRFECQVRLGVRLRACVTFYAWLCLDNNILGLWFFLQVLETFLHIRKVEGSSALSTHCSAYRCSASSWQEWEISWAPSSVKASAGWRVCSWWVSTLGESDDHRADDRMLLQA